MPFKTMVLLLSLGFIVLACGDEPLYEEIVDGGEDGADGQGSDVDTDADTDSDSDGDADLPENPCNPDLCTEGNRTRCVWIADGEYECDCELGFELEDGECVADPDPCDPNPCVEPHRGECRVIQDETVCKCDIGYRLEDDACREIGEVEWVVMVFINGDNNLNTQAALDVQEMMAKSIGTDLVLVNQYDGQRDDDSKRGYITSDGPLVIEELGEIDMGDWHELVNFVKWAADHFKGRHYFLDIWNHGSGWDKKLRQDVEPDQVVEDSEFGWKGISADDHGGVISVAKGDLEKALKEIAEHLGRKIDILSFDACLMQMWEVAYVSEPYADFLLASEETEPGPGYNYTYLLDGLIEEPLLSPADFCSHGVDAYKAASSQHSTHSCIDMSMLPDLNEKIDAFAEAAMDEMEGVDLSTLINTQTQSFSNLGHRDLYHLMENISAHPDVTSGVETLAGDILDLMDNGLVVNEAHQGRCAYVQSCDDAHGLAIFLPGVKMSGASNFDLYRNGAGARWSQETSWDEFAVAFTK